ncbi:MAG: histidine phosphatase family protein [Alphaproteobacteria bacterium]|nr:histidine phosphatase family protein [Alphaproteobacteria bacterium]
MRYIYVMGITIIWFLADAMDLSQVSLAEVRAKNRLSEIKISDQIKGKNVTNFYIFRHAPTSLNRKGIVQGCSLDADVGVLDSNDKSNIIKLKSLGFDYLYTGNSKRSYTTCEFLRSGSAVIDGSWLFQEQNLGLFEGRNREEVKKDPEFIKMNMNPNYKIEGVETGEEVINRMLLGIELVAQPNTTIGICSSTCAMNWFLKWGISDYSSTFFSISNLDVIPFKYDIDCKTISFPFADKIVIASSEVSALFNIENCVD